MTIILFLTCIGISIFLALLANKNITSKYEGNTKNVLNVVTFVVFVLAGLSVFTISRVHNWVNGIINEKVDYIEEIIITAYPENILVTTGINVEEIKVGIDELRNLLPTSIVDDGILSVILEKEYNKYINIVFSKLDSKVNLVTKFSKNGVLTLSSFLGAIENIVFSYCNKAFVIAYLIVLAIVGLYVVCCIFMRNENIMSYNKSITFGGDST
jgi:hypothetical protein